MRASAEQGADPFVPDDRTLPVLQEAVQHCRGCDLYQNATQAVFSLGPDSLCRIQGLIQSDARDNSARLVQGIKMNRQTLSTAITRSGWKGAWEDQIDGLLSKLEFLANKGRYSRLMANIETANNRSNFMASVLEATIAFQFESVGIELAYEIKQNPAHASSIDFRWITVSGDTVFIEARLLQQDKTTVDSIESQLQRQNFWAVAKDGTDEQSDIIRVQQAILEKVQKKDGVQTKFVSKVQGNINIVAIEVSQIILGAFDRHDCLLVAQGDPSVPLVFRRGIFGLFQEPFPAYPDHIQLLGKSYTYLRQTIHGILFLFRHPRMESFNFFLSQFMIWNPSIMREERARAISGEIEPALPTFKK